MENCQAWGKGMDFQGLSTGENLVLGPVPALLLWDVVRSFHLRVLSILKSGGIVVGTLKCVL